MPALIQIGARSVPETTRYLLYRIKTLWPESQAFDTQGQEISHWVTGLPGTFTVSKLGDERDAELRQAGMGHCVAGLAVSLEARTLTIAGTSTACEMVDQIAQDPIWGPDWAYQDRTRTL